MNYFDRMKIDGPFFKKTSFYLKSTSLEVVVVQLTKQ